MSLIRMDVDADVVVLDAIPAGVIATDTTTLSAAIDLTDYPGWRVLLIAGTGDRTDGSYTFSVTQAATSGGSYAALTPVAGSVAAVTAADTFREASYNPSQPFLKVSCVSASTTSGAVVHALLLLLPPR